MRVAILGPALPDRGGIAHETSRLAEELSRSATMSYWTFSRPYPRWLDPRRFAVDSRLRAGSATPILDYLSPRSWRETADRVASCQADALIVPWWTSFWAVPVRAIFRRLAAAAPRTLRVLLCHNLQDHAPTLLGRCLAVGPLLAASAYVVHNEENRQELQRRFPARPLTVVALPAITQSIERSVARERLGVDGPLVLFLGLVRRYKGVDLLLEAAPRIVAETGASIAIVGEVFEEAGPVRKLRESSPVRERILWKDEYVSEEEMSLWLAACDLVVLPYRRISSSAIAARAIGAGRPIAAAGVGGLKDVVLPGETGELFEPEDAGALAAAVARIIQRGGETYRPGLDRAAAEMSWQNYGRRILEFIASARPR